MARTNKLHFMIHRFTSLLIIRYRRHGTPHNSPSPPSSSSSFFPQCGPESPVTMATTERWLQPFENHHASPHHTHARLHMLSVWSNGDHPSRVWWLSVHMKTVCLLLSVPSYNNMTPLSPLTAMKNTFGWKIPPLQTQSNLHSFSFAKTDRVPSLQPLSSHQYHFSCSLVAFCDTILSLHVVEDNVLQTMERMTDCLKVEKPFPSFTLSFSLDTDDLHGCSAHYSSAPNSPLHCSTFFTICVNVCKQGRREPVPRAYSDR